jgi:hypothetical protein
VVWQTTATASFDVVKDPEAMFRSSQCTENPFTFKFKRMCPQAAYFELGWEVSCCEEEELQTLGRRHLMSPEICITVKGLELMFKPEAVKALCEQPGKRYHCCRRF